MAIEIDGISGTGELQQKLDSAYGYEAAGKLDEALQLCAEIIEVDPDLAEVYNLYGVVLVQLGRQQESVAAYERAIKLDPDFEEAKENLAELKTKFETTEISLVKKNRSDSIQDALYVSKRGALAFCLAYGMISIIEIFYLQIPINNQRQDLVLTWIQTLLIMVIMGSATAVLGSLSHRNPLVFGIVGGFGFVFATRTAFATLHFIFPTLNNTPVSHFLSVFSDVIAGAMFGAILGVLTKDKKQMVWLSLAGAIGYGFYGLGKNFYYTGREQLFWRNLNNLMESRLALYVLASIPFTFWIMMIGAFLGGMLGGVLGWFSGKEFVIEDDDHRLDV